MAYNPDKVDSEKHSPYIGVTYDSHVDMYLGDLQVPSQYRHYLPGDKSSVSVYTCSNLDPRVCAYIMGEIMDFIIMKFDEGEDGFDAYFALEGSNVSRGMNNRFSVPEFKFAPLGRGVIDIDERQRRQRQKRRTKTKSPTAQMRFESVVSQIKSYWSDNAFRHPNIIGDLSDNMMSIIAKQVKGEITDNKIGYAIRASFG